MALALALLNKPATASTVKVGLITDTGGVHDSGFNWMAYQGLLRAEADFGVVGTVYTSTTSSDYALNLGKCAVNDQNNLCITVGFLTLDDITAAATAHPSTNFAILDIAVNGSPANLRGINFNSRQAAYLAGILAGSMSQSKVVGDIGGMIIPPVTDFTVPFSNGAGCATPAASTLITYTNSFINYSLGAQVAQVMISHGADVIFAPAGNTGTGAVITATQSGVWGIGVDTDYFETVFANGALPGANKLLTSVLKRIDNGVYNTIHDVVDGSFTGGNVVYGLAEGGVGLAPYHLADAAIPMNVKELLSQVRGEIIAGMIDVNSPVCTTSVLNKFIFLPVAIH